MVEATMTYEFYKILHIAGLLLTVFGLFGLASVQWNGSTPQVFLRKIWMISHGTGLLFLVVSGFGMAARLGITSPLPKWIYAKLVIWLLLGALIALIKRIPRKSATWIISVFVLALAAALLAITKPF
jgi:hypothetical protein